MTPGDRARLRRAFLGGDPVRVDQAIQILGVEDAGWSVEWYGRLGYVQEWVHRFEPSLPAFVSIVRSEGARLFLSEHRGDARPDTLGPLILDQALPIVTAD